MDQSSVCSSDVSKAFCNSGTIRDNKKALAWFTLVFCVESSAWYFHLVLLVTPLNFKKKLSNCTLHSRGMSFFSFSMTRLNFSESRNGAFILLLIFKMKIKKYILVKFKLSLDTHPFSSFQPLGTFLHPHAYSTPSQIESLFFLD